MYLDRIIEINESLIGSDLFDFFPFNEEKERIKQFLLSAFQSLTPEKEIFTDKIELRSPDDTKELFIFKIMSNETKQNQYLIEFSDLTLSKLIEDQLVNSQTFQLLLDLFKDSYISIQTNDGKVLMANNNVIDHFNNGMPLTTDPVFCFDLFRNKSSICENCIGIKAIKENKPQQEIANLKGESFDIETIPIKSAETDLKGYIFVAKRKL